MREFIMCKENEDILLKTKFIKFENGNVVIVQSLDDDSCQSVVNLSKDMLEKMLNCKPYKDI